MEDSSSVETSASLATAKMHYSYLALIAGGPGNTRRRVRPVGAPLRVRRGKGPMMASEVTSEAVAEPIDAHYAAVLQTVRVAARDDRAHAARTAAAHGWDRDGWRPSSELQSGPSLASPSTTRRSPKDLGPGAGAARNEYQSLLHR